MTILLQNDELGVRLRASDRNVASCTNTTQLFFDASCRRAADPAVIAPDGRCLWTFEELARSAASLASELIRRGVAPGDRVLALPVGQREAIRAAAAVLWAGATLVIPPTSLGLRRALRAAVDAKPRAVMVEPRAWMLAAVEPRLLAIPIRVATSRSLGSSMPGLRGLGDLMPPVACSPQQPAVVSFTTGTTGPPKAIVKSHAVLTAQHRALHRLCGGRPDDVDLAGVPLLVLHNLARGVTSVLPPPGSTQSLGFGRATAAAIECCGVTTMAGFPSLFEALARETSPGQLSGLRSMHVGGAHVRSALVRDLLDRAPNAEVSVVYGSTEAEPISSIGAHEYLACEPELLAGRGICVGRPVAEVTIGYSKLTERMIGAGSDTGPILVRGPQVVASNPCSVLDTGDVGRLDECGRLWLMGRAANVGPGPLYPAQVEPSVAALPWVRAAALFNDARSGGVRAALAVETGARITRSQRAQRLSELQVLVASRGWPISDLLLLRRLPRDHRSGSKMDYERLKSSLGRR